MARSTRAAWTVSPWSASRSRARPMRSSCNGCSLRWQESAEVAWVAPGPGVFLPGPPREPGRVMGPTIPGRGHGRDTPGLFRFFPELDRPPRGPDLADEATVTRLVRLVEVKPSTLLPRLRRLIEAT